MSAEAEEARRTAAPPPPPECERKPPASKSAVEPMLDESSPAAEEKKHAPEPPPHPHLELGQRIQAAYQNDDKFSSAKVAAIHPGNSIDIEYDDGKVEEGVSVRVIPNPLMATRGIARIPFSKQTFHCGNLAEFFVKRIAVIVGCNNYGSSKLFDDLRAAENDMELMYQFVTGTLGFAKELVRKIPNATKAQIEEALVWARAQAENTKRPAKLRRNIQFVFFYAGHGYLDAAKRGWIAPTGFDEARPADTGIAMSCATPSLEDFAKSIPAAQQVWLLDSCHAGDVLMRERTVAARLALHHARSAAVHGVAAVAGSELSLERGGHGMFTNELVKTLTELMGRPELKFGLSDEVVPSLRKTIFGLSDGKMTPQAGRLLLRHSGVPCDGEFIFFKASDPPIDMEPLEADVISETVARGLKARESVPSARRGTSPHLRGATIATGCSARSRAPTTKRSRRAHSRRSSSQSSRTARTRSVTSQNATRRLKSCWARSRSTARHRPTRRRRACPSWRAPSPTTTRAPRRRWRRAEPSSRTRSCERTRATHSSRRQWAASRRRWRRAAPSPTATTGCAGSSAR